VAERKADYRQPNRGDPGPFGVHPKTIRFGDKTAKGYLLADFEDAFARYVPSER